MGSPCCLEQRYRCCLQHAADAQQLLQRLGLLIELELTFREAQGRTHTVCPLLENAVINQHLQTLLHTLSTAACSSSSSTSLPICSSSWT